MTTSARERGAIAICLLIIACIHAALLLKNTPTTDRYDELARAFLHGQTYRIEVPPPELLALRDPYDAAENETWREHDLILFHGHFYFYWGPAPAVLIAPIVAVFRTIRINDAWIAWGFAQGTLIAIAMTQAVIRRRWFSGAGVTPIVASLFAVGLATPFPFLFARPSIYEAAILGGQCFAMIATYHAVQSLASERVASARLLAVGSSAALACASRLNLAPAVALLVLALIWELWRRDAPRSLKRLIARGLIVGSPMLCVAIALAAYNQARFGSVRESGIQYMLASRPGRTALSRGQAFSPRYFAANVKNFVLAPVKFASKPPFAFPTRGLSMEHPPRYYRTDFIAGVATAAPVFLLALLPIGIGLLRSARSMSTLFTAGLLVCAAVALALPVLLFFYCSIRYLADFSPALELLAGLGMFQLRSPRGRAFAIGLLIVSCYVGVAIAITGYSGTAGN